MNKLILVILWAIGDIGLIPTAHAIAYQAGAGVLSYTFFNLSASDCTLGPLGPGYSSGGPSWNGGSGTASFFNSPFGGNYDKPESLVTSNYIFYNGEDPIATPASGTSYSLNIGQSYNGTEPSTEYDNSENPAAIGDLWTLTCQAPVGSSTLPPVQLLGSLASASNLLASNVDAGSGNDGYPYNKALSGSFQNQALSPFAAGSGCTDTANPCNIGVAAYDPNTNGWNATATYPYNLNVAIGASNYAPTGGLWLGINSGVPAGGTALAVNTMNAAMFPVNLSSYVQSSSFNSNVAVSGQTQYSTSIYGGHMTLALGDPYVVNSYAAKMLWFTVLNYADINNGTTLANVQGVLSPSSGAASQGVFQYGSMEDNYVNWLFGAPNLAAQAYNAAFTAASTPVTSESIWGKIFSGLADVAVAATQAAIMAIPGASEVEGGTLVATSAAAGTVGAAGVLMPDMNSAIGSAFTSTTSGPAPAAQNAPAVINPTYASANLLGMLLTNVGVQGEINLVTNATNPVNPLWSNYSIYLDNLCPSIGVSDSLFFGNCANSQGQNVPNGSGQAATGTYGNVNGINSTALAIWDPVLIGSDVTTNTDGQMIMGDSINGMAAFSPPIQMLNATNGSAAPTQAISAAAQVTSNFNLQTGVVSLGSFIVNGSIGDPTTPGPTPAPSAQPQINGIGVNDTGNAVSITAVVASAPEYNSSNGLLTVTSAYVFTSSFIGAGESFYYFANGTQTINMTSCAPNAQVTLTVTLVSGGGANGALTCTQEVFVPSATLNYSACTSDQWASGGVFAAVTEVDSSGNPTNGIVACACVPSYLDGPGTYQASSQQLLGGVVVGARSDLTTQQQCPSPDAAAN